MSATRESGKRETERDAERAEQRHQLLGNPATAVAAIEQ
jgi:hypothetical protein